MTAPAKQQLIILDLDRMLLRTHDLERAIAYAIGKEFNVSPDDFRAEMTGLTTDGEGYDLAAHLGRRGWNNTAGITALKRQLRDPSFITTAALQSGSNDPEPFTGSWLFPGAAALIAAYQASLHTDILIVTTGAPGYQQLKLSLCPELNGIPAHIMASNKGEWLAGLWQDGAIQIHGTDTPLDGASYSAATVYDDKYTVLRKLANAPSNVQLIHVLRPRAKYPQSTGLGRVIELTSLTEAPDLPEADKAGMITPK
jgi:hypothetical protein